MSQSNQISELAGYLEQCLNQHIHARDYAARTSISAVSVDNLVVTDQSTKLEVTASGTHDGLEFSHTAKAGRREKQMVGGGLAGGVKLLVSAAVKTAVSSAFQQNPQLEQCANEIIAKHQEQLDRAAGYDGGPLVRNWKKSSLVRWAIVLALYFLLVACFRDYSGGGDRFERSPSLIGKLLVGLFVPGIPLFCMGFAVQLMLTPSRFFTETPRGRRLQALSGVATPSQLKGVAFAVIITILGASTYFLFGMDNWAFINPFRE